MTISKAEFLQYSAVDEDTLEIWIAEQWIIPVQSDSHEGFTDLDVARARLISDLTHGFEVNTAGVGIILDLVDQLHSLRKAVAAHLAIKPLEPDRL